MLRIIIPLSSEGYDEVNECFVDPENYILELEHSLTSLSEWESRWNKPFYTKQEKTNEETVDYIKCMSLNTDIPEDLYAHLTPENYKQIEQYIAAPMTATTFYEDKNTKGGAKEIITAELIYYWMIALNIPFECQHWHLNKLLTLVRVCNIKNTPPKKRSKRDIMSRNAALNAQRRAQLNTKG